MAGVAKKVLGWLSGGKPRALYLWQDREIRFDLSSSQLNPCKGEHVVDIVEGVEDTKGNDGMDGRLLLTNLRIVWHAKPWTDNNLSVGLSLVTSIESRKLTSSLAGTTLAVNIMTTYNGARFQFIFSAPSSAASALLQAVRGTHGAYASSRLYRDIRLRGAFFKQGALQLLSNETLLAMVEGVRNLSASQHSGQMWITNVRLVWTAANPHAYNISVPLVQVSACELRDSKAGHAIVLEVHKLSGGYKLGFQMDYVDAMEALHQQLTSAWQGFLATPVYDGSGRLEAESDEAPGPPDGCVGPSAPAIVATHRTVHRHVVVPGPGHVDPDLKTQSVIPEGMMWQMSESNAEVMLEGRDPDGAAALLQRPALEALESYYADACKGYDAAPVYCASLGLAVEGMKQGVTTQALWNLV